MQPPCENPQICWTCEKNEATEPYIYAGRTTWICATCLPRRRARDELDRISEQIIELEDPGQVDALLANLDAVMEANSKYDHDRRLARMAAGQRVRLLLEAGRYDEAERACKAWAELGFIMAGERWIYGSATAETLDALGRSREGLAVLEDALSHQDPRFVSGALFHLETLAEISEKLGQPVDPKWRSLAQESAAWWNVEVPEHEPLGKAILEAVEAIQTKTCQKEVENSDNISDRS